MSKTGAFRSDTQLPINKALRAGKSFPVRDGISLTDAMGLDLGK